MKKLAVIIMALLPLVSVAESMKAPDGDDIFIKTTDSQSPYFFPALMIRYNAGDTTLTLQDYHYLYYGYALTDDYRPLKVTSQAEDKILSVLEKGELPDYAGMMTIIENAKKVLEDDPFSPKDLNFLAYAYGSIGDTLNERRYFDKMKKVLATIENSGTGMKQESPMHIIMFSHATDLLASKGLTVKSNQVVARNVEFVFLSEKDDKKQLGYYFDFSRIYDNQSDEPAQPRNKKWQFNNMPAK